MSNIFKAYDIRGVYQKEITKETAYNLGRAFVLFLKKEHPKIVVGRDFRASSPQLFNSLKEGILAEKGILYDIELSTTPMLYFASCFLKTDGGIMITASHNPKEYNGFKIVGKNASPISEKTGLLEIKHIFDNLPQKENKLKAEYIKHITKDFNLKDFNFKIGIDTANSVSGILIDDLFKKTNLKVYHINKELDPNFPSHDPDPLQEKNLEQLSDLIKKESLDLGVAFDGDGDRIVFLDEQGKTISSDIVLAIIGGLLKEKVLYDLRCSNIINEVMEGNTEVSRVGHSFIKQIMKEKNIYLGGEYSGHFYLNNKYCYEAPFFILFKLLEQMQIASKKLSEIAKPYQKYFHSGEINFKVDNANQVIKRIKEKYKHGKITQVDGIRIDFNDFWFLLRASNTEPVLRLIIEAKTKELLEAKLKEIKALI